MRCYFMRGGRIEGVTFLRSGADSALIEEAKRAFAKQVDQQFDGFEIWDGTRFVYRSEASSPPSGAERGNG
ncbi:hypothetical protein SAMN02990966_07988 [Rhodospirillales bacterium URHD0017]|nr:hypothetical protein SAMN02990966_07988 [Rhodospirillales bacterium URHD0017]